MENSDTEAKIIQAAENEFLTKGYAGARTTSIAAAAGVTHAMLHYYFRTKENLFERIASEKFSLLKDLILVPLEDFNLSLSEVIRHIINHHIDLLKANPNLPRFILTELPANSALSKMLPTMLGTIGHNVVGLLQKKIDSAAEKGECRRVDARMLMLDIVSLNVFAFLAFPLINGVFTLSGDEVNAFMDKRKQENFLTIMSKLKL